LKYFFNTLSYHPNKLRNIKTKARKYVDMSMLDSRLKLAHTVHKDRRTRAYKEAEKLAYIETIEELSDAVKNKDQEIKSLKSRITHKCDVDEEVPICHICMEDMSGKVTLKCGHEMCPDCFAQHSRINNTCPFCREEFAPKPKKQMKMQLYQLDAIAEMWAEDVSTTTPSYENYFLRQRRRLWGMSSDIQAEQHLRWLITENGKILMRKVKDWYDNDIV